MSINRIIKQSLLTLLFLVFGFNAIAEVSPYKTFETNSLKIKLAKNGTGIVQGIKCHGCDYSIVNITHNSKFTNKGVEVGVAETRERAGQPAMISFTPSTREVQFIRW